MVRHQQFINRHLQATTFHGLVGQRLVGLQRLDGEFLIFHRVLHAAHHGLHHTRNSFWIFFHELACCQDAGGCKRQPKIAVFENPHLVFAKANALKARYG